MRGDQFARQWQVLVMLLERQRGATAGEFAEELGVSVRTVYRDLEVLDRAGVPLVQDRDGRHVRWRLMSAKWRGLGPGFTAEELACLERAIADVKQCGHHACVSDLQNLAKKVRRLVHPVPAPKGAAPDLAAE